MAQRQDDQALESSSIEQSLKQIANCLAFLALQSDSLKGKEKYKDLIPLLASWGFDRHATAALLQTSPASVSVRMSELRAQAKGKASKSMNQVTVESPAE
jgi:hypothetical protein